MDIEKLLDELGIFDAHEMNDEEEKVNIKVNAFLQMLEADDDKVIKLCNAITTLFMMSDATAFEGLAVIGTLLPNLARVYAEDYSNEEVMRMMDIYLETYRDTIEKALEREENESSDGNC